VEGEKGSGVMCKKALSQCRDPAPEGDGSQKDTACGLPHDWEAFVHTGTRCGTQCDAEVGDEYTSNNATYTFQITDARGGLLFAGLPQVSNPCPAVGCDRIKALDVQPGLSSGGVPKGVSVIALPNKGDDSWCMETFCVSSKSAGVKFEYNPAPLIDFTANAAGSVWMNPGQAGPCGGQKSEWKFDLVGPILGECKKTN
jgi:hypothetical protein